MASYCCNIQSSGWRTRASRAWLNASSSLPSMKSISVCTRSNAVQFSPEDVLGLR